MRVVPVDLGVDHCGSNRETHKQIWRELVENPAAGELDWTLVFEDDAVLTAGVDPRIVPAVVHAAAALAANASGHFYLGMCIPYGACRGEATNVSGISIQQCRGHCTHAYGVHKWRARTLAEDAAAAAERANAPTCYLDSMLHKLYLLAPDAPWSLLAGSNVIIRDVPPYSDHRGIFDQNGEFPSVLTPAQPSDGASASPEPTVYPDEDASSTPLHSLFDRTSKAAESDARTDEANILPTFSSFFAIGNLLLLNLGALMALGLVAIMPLSCGWGGLGRT